MKASDFYDATHLFFRDLLAYWLPGSCLIWLVNKGLGKIPSFGVLDAHRLNPYQLGALVGFAVMGGYMTFPLGHWSVNVIRNIAKNVFRDSKMALIQWFFEEQMEADDLRHVRESPSPTVVIEDLSWDQICKADPLWTDDRRKRISKATAKHIPYTYAQDKYPELYKTLVPRHHALKLFHENLTGISMMGFLWFCSPLVNKSWDLRFLMLGMTALNYCAAVYYHRKRDIAIQCLIIVARN